MKKPIQIYKNVNFGKFDVMKVSRILKAFISFFKLLHITCALRTLSSFEQIRTERFSL